MFCLDLALVDFVNISQPAPLFTKTYFRQILWSLKPARLDAIMIEWLWYLIDISTALLP